MKRDHDLHDYRVLFRLNIAGVSKRVDFDRATFSQVKNFVRNDPAMRYVSVWQDGKFKCHLIHRQGMLIEADSPGLDANGIPNLNSSVP